MSIWALADLHLSFGVPNKQMDVFGEKWRNHPEKIAQHWKALVSSDDLVLLAGDFSWAKTLEEVKPDFEWLESLPGTKVLIKGNHDYWWGSLSKSRQILPSSCHLIQNDVFDWKGYTIGGTRLWDTDEYNFDAYIATESQGAPQESEDKSEKETIFVRELQRLEMSLKMLNPQAKQRLVMTHYPPIGADLKASRASSLLEKYRVNVCVFGHIHNMKSELSFGERNGVQYFLTACDFLDFAPLLIAK